MDADEIGRLIGDLENRVERLRSLYEQYFMGIERLEPLTARKDVDRRLWTLRREQIRNTGLRFKLETTVQRYNTYQQYWQRIVREIEQGTYQRDLGRAAQRFGDNAVTGFARRRQKMFEKALSKKAERDTRRTGSQAPVPEAGVDEASPSSNETLDVTFEDAEPASTRAPLPGAAAIPPAPMAPPRVAAGVPPMAPPAPVARPGAVPPPVPPPRPPMASSLGQGAPQPPPVPPPRPPMASSLGQGASPIAKPVAAFTPSAKPNPPIAPAKPITAAVAPKPATPAATPAKPAASVATPAKPPTPMATLAKSMPAKTAAPAASPATRTSPTPAASPPNAAAAFKPALSPGPEPAAPRQAPVAASRPDVRPAVLSEDNSLSPIRMRQIYGQFVEAKRKANESTASVTYEKIAANLENAAKELRAKHKARSVDFEVVMKNGKPVLKPVVKG